MEESYGVAAFRSRQQVLVFNNALQRAGIQGRIVSTPREVSMGCGLSVRFRLEDTADVVRVLRQMNTGNLIGVYRVEVRGAARPALSAIAIR